MFFRRHASTGGIENMLERAPGADRFTQGRLRQRIGLGPIKEPPPQKSSGSCFLQTMRTKSPNFCGVCALGNIDNLPQRLASNFLRDLRTARNGRGSQLRVHCKDQMNADSNLKTHEQISVGQRLSPSSSERPIVTMALASCFSTPLTLRPVRTAISA